MKEGYKNKLYYFLKINKKKLTQLGNTVEWTSEINHIYEISQFKCQIGKYLQERMPILPEHFNETILKNDLPDFNVIRKKIFFKYFSNIHRI